MPLTKGKSEKTFEKNLKTELENGKPMKQSLAIAYAMKKKNKMADGGAVDDGPVLDPKAVQGFVKGFTGKADGGMMDDDDLVMKIMKKRYSEGGQVANNTHPFEAEQETPDQFDDLVLDDNLEADYVGSNEHGDEKEKDDGVVGKIMSKRRKDRNPRPA